MAAELTDGVVTLRPWVESDAAAIVDCVQLRADVENVSSRSAHWNARLGRRQDWAMYSLLPEDLA